MSDTNVAEILSKKEIFNFLSDLREGGEVNMFGAVTYLVEDYNLEKQKAIDLLAEWMKSFGK